MSAQPNDDSTKEPPNRLLTAFLGALWVIFFPWVLARAWWEGGWAKLGMLFFGLTFAAALIGFVIGAFQRAQSRPLEILGALLLFASIFWSFIAGTFSSLERFLWDAFGIALGLSLAAGIAWLFKRRLSTWANDLPEWIKADFRLVGTLLLCWNTLTLVSVLQPAQLPVDADRFSNVTPSLELDAQTLEPWKDLRIGMALSGGGYRAALYHSGTLTALESLGITPRVLSTVSGGSIIGAYYAIGGDPHAFKDAVAAGHFNLKRELLLFHNAIRLPFPMQVPGIEVTLMPWYSFSRREVQASMLDRLLFNHRSHTGPVSVDAPHLIVNTTDLTFAQLVAFLDDGLIITGTDSSSAEVYRNDAFEGDTHYSLADRVSISGAFPLAFPASHLGATVARPGSSGKGSRPLQLVDGGVADNSGLKTLHAATIATRIGDLPSASSPSSHGYNVDLAIASDGSAIFGIEAALGDISQLTRAVDVSGYHGGRAMDRRSDLPTVSFSSSARYLSPEDQFKRYNGTTNAAIDAAGTEDFRNWQVRFSPRDGYPDAVLDQLVTLTASERTRQIKSDWEKYKQATRDHPDPVSRRWDYWMPRIIKMQLCDEAGLSSRANEELHTMPGICEAARMREAISLELRHLLNTFKNTSTLDDQIDVIQVNELYRLGQLMVYLNWPELQRAALLSTCLRNLRMETGDRPLPSEVKRSDIDTCGMKAHQMFVARYMGIVPAGRPDTVVPAH